MGQPAVECFEEFLPLCRSKNLKLLCRLLRDVVVHHFSLKSRLAWILVEVVIDRRDEICSIGAKNGEFLSVAFLWDIASRTKANSPIFELLNCSDVHQFV